MDEQIRIGLPTTEEVSWITPSPHSSQHGQGAYFVVMRVANSCERRTNERGGQSPETSVLCKQSPSQSIKQIFEY